MMSDLIEFLTSKEIVLVYFIAGLSCFVCIIVYLVEKNNDKRRRRHNTKELNKLVEQIKEEVPEEENKIIYEQPVLETINEDKSLLDKMIGETIDSKDTTVETYVIEPKKHENSIEELEYTTIEPDSETAKLELKKLEEKLMQEEMKKEEELIVIEDEYMEEPVIDKVEEVKEDVQVTQLEEDKNIKLTSYEEEQEATAIISLDELLSKGKELYEANEVTQYEDEGNEPISLQDLEAKMDKKASTIENEFVIEDVVPDKNMTKDEAEVLGIDTLEEKKNVGDIRIQPKFKSSPIISPVYGIEGINNKEANELELENTANYEKLDQEIKKTNEFLMTLKELQNKL